ncbi:TIR domain-containing protein [Candidatus Ruminimicrobiellum ovillum]|uniref:TIR domain-containing protein n=1 Tax=Candidatus Ruminimicrobiellum ovillum TaxID=1947927 RepID=UPI003559C060
MYYHVLIETNDKRKIYNKEEYEKLYKYDISDIHIIHRDFVIPYIQEQNILFNGRKLNSEDIRRLVIKQTNDKIDNVVTNLMDKLPAGFVVLYTPPMLLENDTSSLDEIKDVTDETIRFCSNSNNIDNVQENKSLTSSQNYNKNIFIVHGHDDGMKQTVARFLEHIGLNPIILHEQPNEGQTIIEKLEKYIDNCNYGIVLYSPCDIGGINEEKAELKPRARQNVVFEHGYLIGKLGRKRVCCLLKDDIEKPEFEKPGDNDGIIYIYYNNDWKLILAKELKAAKYDIDLNKLADSKNLA